MISLYCPLNSKGEINYENFLKVTDTDYKKMNSSVSKISFE